MSEKMPSGEISEEQVRQAILTKDPKVATELFEVWFHQRERLIDEQGPRGGLKMELNMGKFLIELGMMQEAKRILELIAFQAEKMNNSDIADEAKAALEQIPSIH